MKHFLTKKINGYTTKYYFVDTSEMEKVDGKLPAGLFIPVDQKILINTDQHPEQIESTIRHETLEAINFYYGMGLKHIQIVQLEGALQDWYLYNIKEVKNGKQSKRNR